MVDASSMPVLRYEAKVTAHPNCKLALKVTVGQGVILQNSSDTPQILKAGTVLCGFYKGKFFTPDASDPVGRSHLS